METTRPRSAAPSTRVPASLLALALLVALAAGAFVVLSATGQPWLGLDLSFDAAAGGAVVRRARGPARIPTGTVLQEVEAGGDRLRLVADDFVVEPDGSLGTYARYEAFLSRQERLARMQRSTTVTFTDASGGSWKVSPEARRPLSSLPPDFWVQLVVGVVAWLISSAIWVFRLREPSARYLLLSGAATLTFAPLAGIYSARELALPSALFRWINDANFLGGSLFTAALVGLLLCYPRRLGPSWIGQAIVGVFVIWFVAQQLGAFSSMTLARRLLVMIALLAAFALAGVHVRLTRRDPIGRAALQWLLLSWLVTGAVFGVGILLPQLFGIDTSAFQGYAFSLFLLTYVGLAFGILRFRLFDLGEWWLRIVLWTLSVVLLVLLDVAFLFGLQLSSGRSLGLALLICGVLWLPLRGWLWGRFVVKETQSERALFESVVDIAMTRDVDERARRWRELLREAFDPLDVSDGGDLPRAAVLDDGLSLHVPAVAGVSALRLAYGHAGRRLFVPHDEGRVDDLVGMLRHVIESHDAYQKGASVERARIARDMHDNIGAHLVTALHSEEHEQKNRLIHETLSELRSIVDGSPRAEAPLGTVLSEVRREAAERLAVNGVDLDWPIPRKESSTVPAEIAHELRSIVREALNNVVRHANAKHVRVTVERREGAVALRVDDDGVGFDASAVVPGHGVSNLRSRADALGGSICWTRGPDGSGTSVALEIPFVPRG